MIQIHIGSEPDDWHDIADPNREAGYNAWLLGSSAIIGSLDDYDHTVRVRGVFADNTTTDWYKYNIRPK